MTFERSQAYKSAAMPPVREYVCPGERYAIPRSVHLARLAAGFAACRECPLQHEDAERTTIGAGPKPIAAPSRLRRLLTTDGIRGTARNELDSATAARFAAALAEGLWAETEATGGVPPAGGFPVVVGHDDRPWSMPLAAAAASALRRAGCETIDVGLVTGPEFRFAIGHLDATAGVLATGAGGGPAVAGLDFARSAGRPLSTGGGLDPLVERAEHPAGRPTRRGGRRREYRVTAAYEAGLRRHVTTASRAAGVVGTASPLLRECVERLAGDLPATLRTIPLPRRVPEAAAHDATGLALLSEAVRTGGDDFGLWIGDDGISCRAVDASGNVVPVAALARLAIADALAERPAMPIVVDWSLAEAGDGPRQTGETIVRSNGTAEAMWLSMSDHAAILGADGAGRLWHTGPPAACDALTTLAWLLRSISRHDNPLAERVRASV